MLIQVLEETKKWLEEEGFNNVLGKTWNGTIYVGRGFIVSKNIMHKGLNLILYCWLLGFGSDQWPPLGGKEGWKHGDNAGFGLNKWRKMHECGQIYGLLNSHQMD